MLSLDQTVLVVVDVQGKLAQVMHEREALVDSLQRLVKGARALELPIIWLEQIPEKMGATIPEVADLLEGLTPIPKHSFSGCGEPAFRQALQATDRNQVVLAGIEAHVCVYQTAAQLVDSGYQVEIVADAVSSRTQRNRDIGVGKARQAGASITCVETLLFELMQTAQHSAFRDVLRIVK